MEKELMEFQTSDAGVQTASFTKDTASGLGENVIPAQTCGSCANSSQPQTIKTVSYVYALGSIGIRFPSVSVEREFAQAISRIDTKGLTDAQAMQKLLSLRENRYLARLVCWVMSIEGLETYILVPRDPTDYEMLIEAVRDSPSHSDIDVVIGVQGPIASPDRCNGLTVPIVLFDQIYSFDRDTLIKAIPRPSNAPVKGFTDSAGELLDRIQQIADNAGSTDEHRALNYLTVRYPSIYASTADAHARNFSLTSVEVLQSRLSSVRKILDVILVYTNRTTDVAEKYFVRVDVSDEFPFLVTKLSPYYNR